LATAENTKKVYDDGIILGSIIGRIDIETMKIDFTKKISPTNKFKANPLYSQTKDQVQFLPVRITTLIFFKRTIFKLSLNLK
jgi:hypothetical protein